MALERVSIPTPTAPVSSADYVSILSQLEAKNQAFMGASVVIGSTIHEGRIIDIGGVLYKSTSDTTITGTPSRFVKVTASGATATAVFISNLTNVTWNHVYGGYYHVDLVCLKVFGLVSVYWKLSGSMYCLVFG